MSKRKSINSTYIWVLCVTINLFQISRWDFKWLTSLLQTIILFLVMVKMQESMKNITNLSTIFTITWMQFAQKSCSSSYWINFMYIISVMIFSVVEYNEMQYSHQWLSFAASWEKKMDLSWINESQSTSKIWGTITDIHQNLPTYFLSRASKQPFILYEIKSNKTWAWVVLS